jgi:hypothetical protein
MRITKNQLKQIIKEELAAVIREDDTVLSPPADLVAAAPPTAKLVQYQGDANTWIDESPEGLSRIYAKNEETGEWESPGSV